MRLKVRPVEVRQENVSSLRLMLVGDPNTGKTTVASSCVHHEDMRDVLFIDMDKRMTTLSKVDHLLRIGLGNDHEIGTDLEELMREFGQPRERWDSSLQNVRTIVVDSVSRLKDAALTWAALRDTSMKMGRGRSRANEYVATQRDYGMMSSLINRFISVLVQTNCHLVLLCHTRYQYVESEASGMPVVARIMPDLNPKVKQFVVSYMHHVWYTDRPDEETFEMITMPSRLYEAKITNPAFTQQIKELTTKGMGPQEARRKKGIVIVPYNTTDVPDTLARLWDIYKDSTHEESVNE